MLAHKAEDLRDYLGQAGTEQPAAATPSAALLPVANAPIERGAHGVHERAHRRPHLDAGARIFGVLQGIIDRIAQFLGELVGVCVRRAGDLGDYDYQFRTLPLPWPAGVFQTDAQSAQDARRRDPTWA